MFDGGGGSMPFAVVYSDGNREINLGTIVVDPTLNFKGLLSLLSQRIGISSHQFSVYLCAVGSDRKIPVTTKINLAALHRDGVTYYFFVKRSKRSKKPSPSNGKDWNPKKKIPPENVMLLRRDAASEETQFRTAIIDRAEYENRLRNLQMERESFLMNMGIGFNDFAVGREASIGGGAVAVCEGCFKEKLTGIGGGFHLCVNDKITVGFRSPAGPISRPVRNSGEDCP